MPIGLLIKFGAKYWKIIVIVLAILGAYLYVTGLQDDVEKWRAQYTDEHAAYLVNDARHNDNNTKLQTAIDHQNIRITELNSVLAEAETQIAADAADAALVKAEYELRINGFLTAPKPETCEGAIDYLIDAVPDLQWSVGE
jgi:hypothetical protein